jgi:eukaryotic-like serine/threonine-protein kinase
VADLAAPVDERRYELRGTLGVGGMGAVFRAFDRRLGREVALKALRHASGRDLYRFKREFRALVDMAHPNLVTLHELHTRGDEWFFTMELVDGVPFLPWVRPGAALWPAALGRLDIDRLRAALPQLVEGVMALHAGGKVHRDLKPSNVLVTGDGRVVLLDFGLVSDVGPGAHERTHEAATAVGTPAYMSPEQAADRRLGPSSDWYAVGVMLFEALVGARPFGGAVEDLLRRKRIEAAPSPRDVDPTVPAELDALCARLLARDPEARPDGPSILAALGRAPSPAYESLERVAAARPFVGRSGELAALSAALDDARRGTVAVFVHGESGIGKSQLVRHFVDEVAGHAVVLEGRCYERESVPYKALDAVVDSLAAVLAGQGDHAAVPADAAALARLFPVLRRVPAIAERAATAVLPSSPLELRQRAFGALRGILERLAAIEPVVLSIDDLQWGDADSAVFLRELVHHPDPLPLLLVVTHRTESMGGDDAGIVAQVRAAPAGLRAGDLRSIALGPLPDADARQLVEALGGASQELVVREGRGHPLFLAELAHSTARRGVADLEELIAGRVAALPPSAAALLYPIAVAARPLPLSRAARIAGMPALGGELQILRSERLVRVRRVGDGDAVHVEPYHDRIRKAVVATLDGDALRATHEALARGYQDAGDDREAVVAHWMAAGQPARAAAYAAEAASVAEAALAFHRAAALYALAIEHGADDDVRRALRRRRADALANAGRLHDAAAEYAEVRRDAPPDEAFEAERLRGEQLLRAGSLAEGLEVSRRLLAAVGVALPASRGKALRAVAFGLARARLRGYATTPRREADIAPAVLHKIDLLFSAATGLAFADPLLGRLAQSHFLRAALDAGESRRLLLALAFELAYLGIGGTRHAARIARLTAIVRELAERVDHPDALGSATAMQGYVGFQLGRWKDSRVLLEAGILAMRERGTGLRWELNVCEQARLVALYYLGDAREIIRHVPLALREAVERGDALAQCGLRGWRGNVAWLLMGRPAEARAHLAAVAAATSGVLLIRHFHELHAGVQIELYVGDAHAAHALLAAGRAALAVVRGVQALRIEGTFLLARVATASARTPAERARAARRVRRLARRLDREDALWATALAELARAMAAALDGDRARTGVQLELAERACIAADMALFGAVARHRRGALEGGLAGDAQRRSARDAMLERGVADPDAVARMILPWPAAD